MWYLNWSRLLLLGFLPFAALTILNTRSNKGEHLFIISKDLFSSSKAHQDKETFKEKRGKHVCSSDDDCGDVCCLPHTQGLSQSTRAHHPKGKY